MSSPQPSPPIDPDLPEDPDALPPGVEPYELAHQDPDPVEVPRLFNDLAPIGGVLRTTCEDFEVEEIPLYPFCGEGEHLYLTVRKINRTSLQIRDYLARYFGVKPDDVGFAGFKDKRAVATQTFSIPTPETARAAELDRSFLQLISATRHRNKLRTGHLAGNRFRIRVREVDASCEPVARQCVERLVSLGLPNFYGPQRFGIHGAGHRIGEALLRRDVEGAIGLLLFPQEGLDEPFRELAVAGRVEEALEALPPGRSAEAALLHSLRKHPGNLRAAARRIPRQLRKMYYSAFQSRLFNWVLRERLEWGPEALGTLVDGDLAFIHEKGASFSVESAARESERCRAFEISPSGPMFGRKVLLADGRMGRLERGVLAGVGLRRASFVSHVKGLALDGGRRPLRVPIGEADVRWLDGEDALLVSFSLPPGTFATTLLEQVMGPGRVGALAGRSGEKDGEGGDAASGGPEELD